MSRVDPDTLTEDTRAALLERARLPNRFTTYQRNNERGNFSGALDETLSRYVIKYLYLFHYYWLRE